MRYAEANSALNEIRLPANAQILFLANPDNPALFDTSLKLQDSDVIIDLLAPFVFTNADGTALIRTKESFEEVEERADFKVTAIRVDDNERLIISCEHSITFECLPGVYIGWSVYREGKELVQHHGWGEGVEWKTRTPQK